MRFFFNFRKFSRVFQKSQENKNKKKIPKILENARKFKNSSLLEMFVKFRKKLPEFSDTGRD